MIKELSYKSNRTQDASAIDPLDQKEPLTKTASQLETLVQLYNSLLQTKCYNDNCLVHILDKDAIDQYLKKPKKTRGVEIHRK